MEKGDIPALEDFMGMGDAWLNETNFSVLELCTHHHVAEGFPLFNSESDHEHQGHAHVHAHAHGHAHAPADDQEHQGAGMNGSGDQHNHAVCRSVQIRSFFHGICPHISLMKY